MSNEIIDRLDKLGFTTNDLPRGELSSAVAALMCLPMYMVSNVHGWTDDRQFLLPVLEAHGMEAAREAAAIGSVKAELEIDREHAKVLDGFLAKARPSDVIVYEYALETLRMYLDVADAALADRIREHVARSIVHVAEAAGKALFGGGEKITPRERECIDQIDKSLALHRCAAARAALDKIEDV